MSSTAPRPFMKIDLADFDNRRDEIVSDIMKAASTQGFFYLVNHGIPVEDIQNMFNHSYNFFALPDDMKKKYPLDAPRNAGYEKFGQIRPSTGLPDLKESIQLAFHNTPDLWPSEQDAPGFQKAAEKFMQKCNEVSGRLLTCLAIGLGFPDDFFTRCHDITQPDSLNTLRCIHYHEISGQSMGPKYCRAGAHTDLDSLTLLFQRPGEHGLEMCPGRQQVGEPLKADENDWIPLQPEEDEIVCNIGDMIMRWSDDQLKSNFHRVRCPRSGEYQGSRYSMAYFNQANRSAIIQGRTKYTEPVTAGEMLRLAMERNYQIVKAMETKKATEAAAANIVTNHVVKPASIMPVLAIVKNSQLMAMGEFDTNAELRILILVRKFMGMPDAAFAQSHTAPK
ncbi:uncharacterized protein BYT42DRAFT_547236 [Radiomyces spectabilis]|uniref:uncharacterized protein n=1 Tax=Radiomyces spectabilis TaxID=64574 RepID=UPI00221F45C8|nr:uncharacterized protein BYT42DRAFT_547236 [Radiomyces spectabilis]KAI8374144.1 hypothetical protein BYT42DRAFT_547236 [Radiomyces spectabilis]